MNIEQATKTLEDFNKWRRGAEMEQPNSKTIGEAIDYVANYHKELIETYEIILQASKKLKR